MKTTSFNEFLASQLNPEQREAVTHKSGPLLVIAGAGSGKTRVITARIINLIVNEHVDPSAIIALTFTNKAAREMKERIELFLPDGFRMPMIGTFHSYCLQLLREHAHLLKHPVFAILDSDDQKQMLQSIIKRHNLEKVINAKVASYHISTKKNSLNNAPELYSDPMLDQIYLQYEQEKAASKLLDFDDLLLEGLKLFNDKDFKEAFHAKVRHILVDEYQDTNVVQHALLKEMAKNKKDFAVDSLCAVGDEDQSIYSWRGATVANILNFKNDFAHTVTIKIEQNYRSVKPILDIANTVIKHNENRNPKKLWSSREAHDRARIITCVSGYQEGEAIAQLIKATAASGKSLHAVAILYRAHYQSRMIEEALLRNAIAYKIIGGIQFYERKEIKDMLAYLRLLINPFDRVSFFRVINTPGRGLGEKFEEQAQTIWALEPLYTFYDLCHRLAQENKGKKAEAIEDFAKLFKGLEPTDSPAKTISTFIDRTDYIGYLKTNFDPQEADSKIDNLKELLRAVDHIERTNNATIQDFLAEVALMQEKLQESDEDKDFIQMMTMHAAKGLEFDTVVICGLEEGLFPSGRSIGDPDTLEEERRLFYVGITRARERLVLTHSRYRHSYGSMTDQVASRFLKEVPQHLAMHQDVSKSNTSQLYTNWAQWFGLQLPESSVVTFGAALKSIFVKKEPVKAAPAIAPREERRASPTINELWKKNQPVKHPTFGIGVIESVEEKDNKTIYVTARFKVGTKKIKSDFLSKV